MRNENFYSLAAQVLPALLIAVILEIRGALGTIAVGARRDRHTALHRSWTRSAGYLVLAYVAVAVCFVLGEASALLVVFVGPGGWLVRVAAPVVALALLLLTVAAIAVPAVGLGVQTGVLIRADRDQPADESVSVD
ncbi:hypothetical protein Lfu02_05900 [Longispora fulva]|uniref:Uncharacterized protein n=1 Tax=Longispora fulva TaxID=619741 RepID=A0A8J7G8A2_9ACTN|nr:hypothetical protein [Longispora fulva]MBG6135543.1 hypothetical protein [Longispora fulva]GIG56218.1 hypothetical protein Lfu02_05900 [Longispora fulva]